MSVSLRVGHLDEIGGGAAAGVEFRGRGGEALPILAAAWKVRFMLRATATVPWPFTAAWKASSIKAKMAEPWTIPRILAIFGPADHAQPWPAPAPPLPAQLQNRLISWAATAP